MLRKPFPTAPTRHWTREPAPISSASVLRALQLIAYRRGAPARCILHLSPHSTDMSTAADQSSSAAHLLEMFWQRIMKCPSALAATTDAFLARRTNGAVSWEGAERTAAAFDMYVSRLQPRNEDGRHFLGWDDLLGSDNLQRYALEALAVTQPSTQPQLTSCMCHTSFTTPYEISVRVLDPSTQFTPQLRPLPYALHPICPLFTVCGVTWLVKLVLSAFCGPM